MANNPLSGTAGLAVQQIHVCGCRIEESSPSLSSSCPDSVPIIGGCHRRVISKHQGRTK
jgi:hypothetical protein